MLFTPSQSFTRPTNTTAYQAADLVANDVDAADVLPLTWGLNHFGKAGFFIRAARLYKSSTTVTAASFRLHLFTASPGVPTNGDNGALAVASAADFLDSVAIDLSSGAFVGTAGVSKRSAATAIGVWLPPGSNQIFGLLEALGAYAPASGETFRVTLECEVA